MQLEYMKLVGDLVLPCSTFRMRVCVCVCIYIYIYKVEKNSKEHQRISFKTTGFKTPDEGSMPKALG